MAAAGPLGLGGGSGTLDEASTRTLVEQAVLRDEAAPLLRILFDVSTAAAAREAKAAEMAAAAAAVAVNTASTARETAASAAVAAAAAAAGLRAQQPTEEEDGKQAIALISKCLRTLAQEQDQAIKDICTTHAKEIAGCVSDLHEMSSGTAAVNELLGATSTVLQESGAPLQGTAHSLAELLAVRRNVEGGLEAVRRASALVRQYLQVGDLLEARQLDGALALIQQIQSTHLGALLDSLLPPGQSSAAVLATPPPAPAGTSNTGPPLGQLPSPPPQQGSSGAAGAGGAAGPGGGAAGRHVANVVALRVFLERALSELLTGVESAAISEMHAWLMTARDRARDIGLQAVRKVAITRQLDDSLARERLLLAAQLTLGDRSVAELASSLLHASFRKQIAAELAPPTGPAVGGRGEDDGRSDQAMTGAALVSVRGVVPPPQLPELKPGAPHLAVQELFEKWGKQQRRAAARVAAVVRASAPAKASLITTHGPGTLPGLGAQLCVGSDATGPLLAELNMRGLLTCLHIHKALGRLHRLREYYVEQRRLQIAADLAAPYVPFLENYQAYLGQVVGFFVIEAAVSRTMPELHTGGPAALLWDNTAQHVRVVLERALCVPGSLLATGPGPGSTTRTTPRGTPVPTPANAAGAAATSGDVARSASPAPAGKEAPPTKEQTAAQAALAARDMERVQKQAPPIMVLIKDFVLLACETLEGAGCPPHPLQEVLVTASQRYHELLLGAALSEASTLLSNDPLTAEYTVRTASEAATLCGTLGLPACRDASLSSPAPAAPFTAPYPPHVPGLVRLFRGYVSDSVSYVRGLVPDWEMEAAACLHRDAMVQRVVNEVVLPHIAGLATQGKVAECMRMVSGAWALTQAVSPLNAHLALTAAPPAEADAEVQRWTTRARAAAGAAHSEQGEDADLLPTADIRVRQYGGGTGDKGLAGGDGGSSGADSTGGDTRTATAAVALFGGGASPPLLSASLSLVLDSAERALLRHVTRRLDTLLVGGFKATPWQPTTALDPGPSDHIQPLIALLQETFDAAAAALPRTAWAFLVRTSLQYTALMYLKLFAPDSPVRGYNLAIIERLAFDISALQNFAARLVPRPAPPPTAPGSTAASSAAAGGAVVASKPGGGGAGASQPYLVVGLVQLFAEPSQLFQLLLSGQMEAVLSPDHRRQRYPDLELSTIVLALDKYREQLKLGKDKTAFPTNKQVEGLVKALRTQMASHRVA